MPDIITSEFNNFLSFFASLFIISFYFIFFFSYFESRENNTLHLEGLRCILLVVWYFYREKTCDALTLHYHEANAAVIFAFLHSTILILNVLWMYDACVVKIGALVSFGFFMVRRWVYIFFSAVCACSIGNESDVYLQFGFSTIILWVILLFNVPLGIVIIEKVVCISRNRELHCSVD